MLLSRRHSSCCTLSHIINQFNLKQALQPFHYKCITTFGTLVPHHIQLVPFLSFLAPSSQTAWVHHWDDESLIKFLTSVLTLWKSVKLARQPQLFKLDWHSWELQDGSQQLSRDFHSVNLLCSTHTMPGIYDTGLIHESLNWSFTLHGVHFFPEQGLLSGQKYSDWVKHLQSKRNHSFI